MVTITKQIFSDNPQTQAVINYMSGKRTAKQIVWEFFWLNEEAIYDDNWENVLDYINDFKDLNALKQKKVRYVEKLWEMGVTEEMFNKLFSNWLPDISTLDIKWAKKEIEVVETPIITNEVKNEKWTNSRNISEFKTK